MHSSCFLNGFIVKHFRIPALLVLAILVLYTALGGVLMSKLEPWTFFTSFYWSFITMTTVSFSASNDFLRSSEASEDFSFCFAQNPPGTSLFSGRVW